MSDQQKWVVVTYQPGAIGGAEKNAYIVDTEEEAEGIGHGYADGATPPMTFDVLPGQPPPGMV